MFLEAFNNGFLFSLSLIVAIGAQNMLVLRQGLILQHVFTVCLMCALSDAALIQIGVLLMGKATTINPIFTTALRYCGAVFLFVYGLLRFQAAWQGNESLQLDNQPIISRKKMILMVLAFTWLNPHVYLDTVLLLGTIAQQFAPHQDSFAGGAMFASFIFFFGLGYGARILRPFLTLPQAWQILEVLTGCLMFYFSIGLLLENSFF